jgi:DNA-binding transcriptional regulator WhiA
LLLRENGIKLYLREIYEICDMLQDIEVYGKLLYAPEVEYAPLTAHAALSFDVI